MLEMEQRSQRSGNLIFFGLPEQNDGSVEERRKAELQTINVLLTKIDADTIVALPQTFYRLGRPSDGKPHPLRITGSRTVEKSEILRKSKHLRSHDEYYPCVHQP